MNKVKRFALAFLAVVALGAAGSASASASGYGEGTLVWDMGDPCPISFFYDGNVAGSGSISEITTLDDTCMWDDFFQYDVSDEHSDLSATFTGDSSSGTVSFSGELGINMSGNFIGCGFNTSVSGGTGPLTGSYSTSGSTVSYDLSTETIKLSGEYWGLFGCPPFTPDMQNAEIQDVQMSL